MIRLYFLAPDVTCAKEIVNDLLLAKITERHIQILAKDNSELREENLPEANLLLESDFVPAVQKGIAAGGTTGLLAGLAAIAFPPAGLVLGGGALLITTLAGAGFGAWASSMIGISVPNTQLKAFEDSIEKGAFLMVVDVAKSRADEIQDLVRKHHPEADIEGIEPNKPIFP